MPGPLNGLVVADFSQLAQGPYATQMFGDLGAEIIKIEPPQGDWMRSFALQDCEPGGESISYLSFNRNKRSISLNLRDQRGLAIAKEICAKADILVENFRPGVMDRLGLGYAELAQTNPGLVYTSSSGYGSSGPYVTRPGQDLLIQAITGLPTGLGREGDPPVNVALGIADLTAGLHIAYSTLAAIIHRNATGKGQHVEVNLLNSLLAMQAQELNAFLQTGVQPPRSEAGIGSPWAGAPFGLYQTADGYIAIAMTPVNLVARIVGVDGLEGVDGKSVIPDRDNIKRLLEEGTRRWRTDELLARLLAEDVWCAPLQDYAQVIQDPQVLHNQMIAEVQHPTAGNLRLIGVPVAYSDTRAEITKAPPRLSEHAREILAEFTDLDQEALDALFADKVVGVPA
ncbi:CaiB/BaiF CoA transferase family protein [Microbacterium sulfonylureivorans]|uniref:CaiB/BaiF CoA transferase family protein n=1 Tax=Microbacterium sulfonylureivorans TaxID=2486854 RepID=UPI000FDC59A4|nr:CoA transferase [Microbacterium sulfonylureivorans]